jgi:hypothetical protein
MIGVLLTSTCFYPGTDGQSFSDRVQELCHSISTLDKYVPRPFELIIADNSPADCVPTEKILKLRPCHTLFIRSTENPGKQIGEAVLIRDGVHLSAARGHTWLLKITGRYFLDGEWSWEDTVEMLEAKRKPLYLHLVGRSFRDSPHAANHPLYNEYLHTDKILMGAATSAFLCDPAYLVRNEVFHRHPHLYRPHEWLNLEQLFFLAVRDLDFLHWPRLPINGFVKSQRFGLGLTVAEYLRRDHNPLFETTEDYGRIPRVETERLLAE